MCTNNWQFNINQTKKGSFTGSNGCFLNEVLLCHNSITLPFHFINPGHIDIAALSDYNQVESRWFALHEEEVVTLQISFYTSRWLDEEMALNGKKKKKV